MGTLTDNVASAIAELRQGRVEFKMDKTGIVHVPIGKAYFEEQALYLNIGALAGVYKRPMLQLQLKGAAPIALYFLITAAVRRQHQPVVQHPFPQFRAAPAVLGWSGRQGMMATLSATDSHVTFPVSVQVHCLRPSLRPSRGACLSLCAPPT
jgi:hypothetical protein